MIRPFILATVCACCLAARGGDEETHFKPKAYEPRQALSDRTYRETAYKPSSASQSVGKRIENPGTPSRWRLFGREKTLDDAKKLTDVPVDHEMAYKQEKQISVSTLKADPRDIQDKKPFVESDKKLTDATFKEKTEPREKNPLLAPRQGIKAPE